MESGRSGTIRAGGAVSEKSSGAPSGTPPETPSGSSGAARRKARADAAAAAGRQRHMSTGVREDLHRLKGASEATENLQSSSGGRARARARLQREARARASRHRIRRPPPPPRRRQSARATQSRFSHRKHRVRRAARDRRGLRRLFARASRGTNALPEFQHHSGNQKRKGHQRRHFARRKIYFQRGLR